MPRALCVVLALLALTGAFASTSGRPSREARKLRPHVVLHEDSGVVSAASSPRLALGAQLSGNYSLNFWRNDSTKAAAYTVQNGDCFALDALFGVQSAQLSLDVHAGRWMLQASSDAVCGSPLAGAVLFGLGLGEWVAVDPSLYPQGPLSLQVIPAFQAQPQQQWPLDAPLMASVGSCGSLPYWDPRTTPPSIRGVTPGVCVNTLPDPTTTSWMWTVSADDGNWTREFWTSNSECAGDSASVLNGTIGTPSTQPSSEASFTLVPMGKQTCFGYSWGTCRPGYCCRLHNYGIYACLQ
jgi:hypothetical protein